MSLSSKHFLIYYPFYLLLCSLWSFPLSIWSTRPVYLYFWFYCYFFFLSCLTFLHLSGYFTVSLLYKYRLFLPYRHRPPLARVWFPTLLCCRMKCLVIWKICTRIRSQGAQSTRIRWGSSTTATRKLRWVSCKWRISHCRHVTYGASISKFWLSQCARAHSTTAVGW